MLYQSSRPAIAVSEICPHKIWKPRTIVANGKHTGEEIMNSSGKYAPEDDPEIGGRAKLRAHNCSENRPRSGNVQKLDHLDLPCRHRHIINSVGSRDSRSFPG